MPGEERKGPDHGGGRGQQGGRAVHDPGRADQRGSRQRQVPRSAPRFLRPARRAAGSGNRAPAKATPPAQARKPPRQPWTRSQEKLALLYNEQGLRPDEIARKLGLSPYLVTQIILNTRTKGKL